MARNPAHRYEIWGSTDGRDLIAVRRSGTVINGFNANTNKVRSAGQADRDGGTEHLEKLKYYQAQPRAVRDFNERIGLGKLARIR